MEIGGNHLYDKAVHGILLYYYTIIRYYNNNYYYHKIYLYNISTATTLPRLTGLWWLYISFPVTAWWSIIVNALVMLNVKPGRKKYVKYQNGNIINITLNFLLTLFIVCWYWIWFNCSLKVKIMWSQVIVFCTRTVYVIKWPFHFDEPKPLAKERNQLKRWLCVSNFLKNPLPRIIKRIDDSDK